MTLMIKMILLLLVVVLSIPVRHDKLTWVCGRENAKCWYPAGKSL